jgi:hypothetical protein
VFQSATKVHPSCKAARFSEALQFENNRRIRYAFQKPWLFSSSRFVAPARSAVMNNREQK